MDTTGFPWMCAGPIKNPSSDSSLQLGEDPVPELLSS